MDARGEPLPSDRIVLLGASNLTRGLGEAIAAARAVIGRPARILVANGNGRSYGATSSFMWRSLPAIVECGLWDAYARLNDSTTSVLITDIGNDILYGHAPEVVEGWVEACLSRLGGGRARIVIAGPPVCSLITLSRNRFLFFRSLFVPGCKLDLVTVADRVTELSERLIGLCARSNVAFVRPLAEWYGADPIHVRRSARFAAFAAMAARWSMENIDIDVNIKPPSWLDRIALRLLSQERRWIAGREFRRAQPVKLFPDGSSLALF